MKRLKRPKKPLVLRPGDNTNVHRAWVMVMGKHDEWLQVLITARELWRKGKVVLCHTSEKPPKGDELQKVWEHAPLYPVWRAFVDPIPGELALDMAFWSRFHSRYQVQEVLEEVERRTGMRLYDLYWEARKSVLRDVEEAWEEYLEE